MLVCIVFMAFGIHPMMSVAERGTGAPLDAAGGNWAAEGPAWGEIGPFMVREGPA